MATERDTLLEKAYPEALAFCQKHGLMFEVNHFSLSCPKAIKICGMEVKKPKMLTGFPSP